MFKPNGGRQQLRKTVGLRPDHSEGAGPSSSSPPVIERTATPGPASASIPGVHASTGGPEEQDVEGDDMVPMEFNMESSFQLYGHSNDSADLYSINSTSGFRETTEELDPITVENMMLREDYGKMSLFLQRNYPEIYNQFASQSGNMATQMQVYHDAPASNPHQLPPRSSSLSSSTSSLQAQLKRKDHDLNALHLQRTQQENELVSLRKQVKGLQDFIIQSRNKVQALEGIIDYDDVYFEREYKQLAAAVKDWCWKLSRGAGIFVGSKDDREKVQGRAGDEHEPPFLSREEIERLMKTHSKIGVTTAFVVDRIWYGCWSRYAPGLTEEEELILKQFEDDMRRSDKIPMASINRWRATTLSLLTKFPKYTEGVSMQAATLVTDICQTLSRLLVTPSTTNDQRPTTADERSLTRILEKAMTLYAQMRGQRSRFELVFPSKGDRYDCRMMEDSSDILVYDEEDLMGGTVGAVAFPGVIKYGEEQEIDRIPAKDTSDRPTAASPVPAGAAAENVKPRVLVKARVLCIVPDE